MDCTVQSNTAPKKVQSKHSDRKTGQQSNDCDENLQSSLNALSGSGGSNTVQTIMKSKRKCRERMVRRKFEENNH